MAKKKLGNSPEQKMSHKQSKTDHYWLSKLVLISNSFDELQKILNDINDE